MRIYVYEVATRRADITLLPHGFGNGNGLRADSRRTWIDVDGTELGWKAVMIEDRALSLLR
jgi:hypothetical protein